MLSALEENSKEFVTTKKQLMDVLQQVKEMNVKLALDKLYTSESDDEKEEDPMLATSQRRGDVLSELIERARLEEQRHQREQDLREKVLRERRMRLARTKIEHTTKKQRAQAWLRGELENDMGTVSEAQERLQLAATFLNSPAAAGPTHRRMSIVLDALDLQWPH